MPLNEKTIPWASRHGVSISVTQQAGAENTTFTAFAKTGKHPNVVNVASAKSTESENAAIEAVLTKLDNNDRTLAT